MRAFRIAAILFFGTGAFMLVAALSSCATTQKVADVSGDACKYTPEIIDATTAALKRPSFSDELSKIVAEFCAVRAAVVEVVQREETAVIAVQASGALDPIASAIIVNGRAWLDAHPVDPSVKAGLPGGGHTCTWKPGTWFTIVAPPNCPAPAVQITQTNLQSKCSCAPIALWSP